MKYLIKIGDKSANMELNPVVGAGNQIAGTVTGTPFGNAQIVGNEDDKGVFTGTATFAGHVCQITATFSQDNKSVKGKISAHVFIETVERDFTGTAI